MNRLALIIFLSLFLNACSTSDYIPDWSLPTITSFIKPYKADIHQGSVLKRSTIGQLKIGMLKPQVHDLIGPPSIIDPFHNNQWDYVNYTTLGSGKIVHYRLTLTFKENKLNDINTDGISSLPKMTDEEKTKEQLRLTQEAVLKKALLIKEKTEE